MAKLRPHTPKYLTTNQAGTYVFQVRVPRHIWQNNPSIKPTIWQSLGTKNHVDAMRKSKRMWVMFDGIINQFSNPKVRSKATDLLIGYFEAKAEGRGFDYVQSLDDTLEGGDFALFERALQAFRDTNAEQLAINSEQEELKRKVESLQAALSAKESSGTGLSNLSREELVQVLSEVVSQSRTVEGPDFSNGNDRYLSDVIDEYMRFKIDNELKPGSQHTYRPKLKLFLDVIEAINHGEKARLSHLTHDVMRQYSDAVTKFPSNYKVQPAFKGKDLAYVLGYINERTRAQLEDEGIVISSDKKERFRIVRALFEWIRSRKYPLHEGLEQLITLGKGVEGKKKKSDANLPYTPEELKLLFENEKYRFAKKRTGAIDYWAPLISIHTGATLSEICQLHFEDIRNVDGIDVFDINENGWKILKNDDGRPRLIPIHPNLKKLGFLTFVERRRAISGSERIFPEAERDKADKYDETGSRFRTFRKSCGIKVTNKTKTFHSFRSTVSTFLRENGCPEGIANDIIGHSSEHRSETYKTYAKNKTLVQITYEWVKKIDFGVDFNYPKQWRD